MLLSRGVLLGRRIPALKLGGSGGGRCHCRGVVAVTRVCNRHNMTGGVGGKHPKAYSKGQYKASGVEQDLVCSIHLASVLRGDTVEFCAYGLCFFQNRRGWHVVNIGLPVSEVQLSSLHSVLCA